VGTIDKKLIYRKRKGINDVKKYTKTVNPDLPGQLIQKEYFKEAIEAWKIDGYSKKDIEAWNLYARTLKKSFSGFNMFARFKINADIEEKTWEKLTNCIIYNVTGVGFKVDININSDLSGKLYIGSSKFSMIREITGVFSVNKYTFEVNELLQETKYYFFIKNTAAGKNGRTGIYSKKTTKIIPIEIDIGSPAIDRASGITAGYTLINEDNPANESGKIYKIEIWSLDDLYNVEIATFYEVSEKYFSTRDNVFIGTVEKGAKRTFQVVLNVVEGDYIGAYVPTGRIKRDTEGYAGLWYREGDMIPCVEERFFILEGDTISLFGVGTD